VARYVALLRGINLGARNKVPMARLRELIEEQGASNVRTYIASGNVLLEGRESAPKLRTKLERAIESEFGFPVLVAVLKVAELQATVARNPYKDASPGSLHVAFTVTPLTAAEREALAKLDVAPEELSVAKSHVYLHMPGGFAGGALTRHIDRLIGKRATIRNWRTVETLARMATESE
jgi:uncharacterized protein (DUF1697 family)